MVIDDLTLEASDMSDRRRVTVVGAGPVGLMSALMLALAGCDVTVISPQRPSNTTGFQVAAGLIEPVASEGERVLRWFGRTLAWMLDVRDHRWGIEHRMVRLFGMNEIEVMPSWGEAIGGLVPFESTHPNWNFEATYQSAVLQPDIALGLILELLKDLGVSIEECHDFEDLDHLKADPRVAISDTVVVTTGAYIGRFNPKVVITAGVGVVIRTIGIPADPEVLMTSDLTYRIPQRDHTVWGGCLVEQLPEEPFTIEEHLEEIVEKLVKFDASWPVGDIDGQFVGARPLSPEPILDIEHRDGHTLVFAGGLGGSGWTLVIGLVEEMLERLDLGKPKLI